MLQGYFKSSIRLLQLTSRLLNISSSPFFNFTNLLPTYLSSELVTTQLKLVLLFSHMLAPSAFFPHIICEESFAMTWLSCSMYLIHNISSVIYHVTDNIWHITILEMGIIDTFDKSEYRIKWMTRLMLLLSRNMGAVKNTRRREGIPQFCWPEQSRPPLYSLYMGHTLTTPQKPAKIWLTPSWNIMM